VGRKSKFCGAIALGNDFQTPRCNVSFRTYF
jgi:hypothetical protein